MQATIILFGQLTDITGTDTIVLNDIADTDGLVIAVNKLYPAMTSVQYVIAVDKKITRHNTIISETSQLALLPPFSGG